MDTETPLPSDVTMDKRRRWLSLPGDVTAEVAGAGAGMIIGGPTGALVGAAASPALAQALRHLTDEFMQRTLGKREHRRVAKILVLAAKRISENLEAGENLRTDGFFEATVDDRSAAEEILEGVLLAAQREHEERKLPHMANLYAEFGFEKCQLLDRSSANHLLRLAQALSYDQFCLLTVLGSKYRTTLREHSYDAGTVGADAVAFEPIVLTRIEGIFDLWHRGLVDWEVRPDDSPFPKPPPHTVSVAPARMKLMGLGVALYELLALDTIDPEERQAVITALRQ